MKLVRAGSVVVTAALLVGAVAIGGGHPLSPASVAGAARRAAHDTALVVRNISRAADAARSFATIEDHVVQQLDASRAMLRTQRRIEAGSRRSLDLTRGLSGHIRGIAQGLARLGAHLGRLSALSQAITGSTRAGADSAQAVDRVLQSLQATYGSVIELSRELDRKARGYRKAHP